MKIAIIGTGISGLTAGFYLNAQHDITVYEASDRIGGHTNTVRFELEGVEYGIDTGFIVFNEHRYPHFVELMNTLGVKSKPTSMSFSVSSERTGLEYNGSSLDQLFAQKRNTINPRFLRMICDIVRFGKLAPGFLDEMDDETSVEYWVSENRLGIGFLEDYLLPLGSALWSCSIEDFRAYPMRFVVEFLNNHAMLQVKGRPEWRVICAGSSSYIQPLISTFKERIVTGCPVECVKRIPGGVKVVANGKTEVYDHVVFACHADQALRINQSVDPTEQKLLGHFPYEPNSVVLHTDTGVLPKRRKVWASWNARVPKEPTGHASTTYNMNMLQGLDVPHTFCVTLNDQGGIDEGKVIKRLMYDHPQFTPGRYQAQQNHHLLIGRAGVSYCGAYWGYGFHEDGVRSAIRVVNHLREHVRKGVA